MSGKQSNHEDAEQKAVFDWAKHVKELRWLHAVPNGGRRDPREAARLKSQGVKPGVSDLCLPLARNGYHGLYIEMKRSRKQGASRVTPDQQEFLDHVRGEGYLAQVCYGAESAIAVLKAYIGRTGKNEIRQ